MAQPAPSIPAAGAARTGIALLHALFGAATALWLLFTQRPAVWPLVGAAVCGVVLLLLSAFLAHQGAGRATRWAWLGWIVVALVASHVSLGAREGIWAGFRFDASLGWYPEADSTTDQETVVGGSFHVVTDALGHRNPWPYPADNHLPVLLQGDSNAFGFGLQADETFCAVYTERSGTRCYNFGVPGFDVQQYYLQYERVVRPRFTADRRVILLAFGNDYTLSALASPYLIPRPYLWRDGDTLATVQPPPLPFRKQVYGHHFIKPYAEYDAGLATVIVGRDWGRWMPPWFAALRLPAFVFEMAYPRALDAWYAAFAPDAIAAGQALNPYYPPWLMAAPEHWPEPYRAFRADFAALYAALAAQHPNTAVVAFPMRNQVLMDADASRQRLVDLGYPAEAFDRRAINRYLAGLARDNGVAFYDATDDLLADPDPRSLYQQRDEHLSPRGMRLVVERLLQRLP
jgi:hypothetical protein